MLGLRKEICEGHLGGGVHTILGKIITKQLPGDFLGEETWFLCTHMLPSPRNQKGGEGLEAKSPSSMPSLYYWCRVTLSEIYSQYLTVLGHSSLKKAWERHFIFIAHVDAISKSRVPM